MLKPKASFLLAIFIYLLSTIIPVLDLKPAIAASQFALNTDITIEVSSKESVLVKENFTVTNLVDNQYLSQIRVTLPTDRVESIIAKYSDGLSIDYEESSYSGDSDGVSFPGKVLTLKFPRSEVGRDRKWQFYLEYSAPGLIESRGVGATLFIPKLEASDNQSYDVNIAIAKNLGDVHVFNNVLEIVKENVPTNYQQDFQYYRLTDGSIGSQAIGITIGDVTIYNLELKYPITNNSNKEQNYEITLPPNTNQQSTYFTKFDPKPLNTRYDNDGNLLASYKLKARQNLEVKISAYVTVHYLEYDLSKSQKKSDITNLLKQQYTSQTEYWNSDDPDMLIKAKNAGGYDENVITVVHNIYDYVINTLSYNPEKIKYNIRQGANIAINNPSNSVCLEYADVMIALLRSLDIPARMVVGYAYTAGLKNSASMADSLHSWVQVFVPGIGWMDIDPTWGEKYQNFGVSDLDHVALAIWGLSDQQPMPIMNGDKIGGDYQYEKSSVDFIDKLPTIDKKIELKINNYLIFPGISILRGSVKGAAGQSLDNIYLTVNDQGLKNSIKLNRVAPLENLEVKKYIFGLDSLTRIKVSLKQPRDTTTAVLSTFDLKPNWSIMIVLSILLILLTIGGYFYLANRNSRRTNPFTELIPMKNNFSALSSGLVKYLKNSEITSKIKDHKHRLLDKANFIEIRNDLFDEDKSEQLPQKDRAILIEKVAEATPIETQIDPKLAKPENVLVSKKNKGPVNSSKINLSPKSKKKFSENIGFRKEL